MLIPQQGLGAAFAALTDIDMVEYRKIWGVGMKILLSGILEHIMEAYTAKETLPSSLSDGPDKLGTFQLGVSGPGLFPQ